MRLTLRQIKLSAIFALSTHVQAQAQEDAEALDVFQPTVTLDGDTFALITEAPAPPNLDLFRQKRDDSSLIGWFSQSGYCMFIPLQVAFKDSAVIIGVIIDELTSTQGTP